MGMYDTYFPAGLERCPRCQRKLDDWQGKDGPYGLLAWQQGVEHPIGFFPVDADQVEPFPPGDEDTRTLPPVFRIYASCGKHRMEAEGRAPDGVWIETIVKEVLDEQIARKLV